MISLCFLQIKVETQEEGFTIKVVCEKSCQGLLTFILEAFEKLGLDVLQARASCVEKFSLEAFGIKVSNTSKVKHSFKHANTFSDRKSNACNSHEYCQYIGSVLFF